MPRKYSKATQTEVKREMHRFKKGTAHSGRALKPVKSRQQAIAIALSKARKKGKKVPTKATSSSRTKTRTSTVSRSRKNTGVRSRAKTSRPASRKRAGSQSR